MWWRSAGARCCISRPARRLALALCVALPALAPCAPPARAQPAPGGELGFIEALYRSGDGFRAESEALRWLHGHPRDPARPAVELLRAKLYYRERRYPEADLMLHSLLDRFPRGEAVEDARRLLAYSHLRQGRLDEAERLLAWALPPAPGLEPLRAPAPAALEKETALAWSTWLPGAGFLVLGQPAKAAAAFSLNVAATAAAVLSYRQGNTAAALLFALVEIALYRGGREAVVEEAERLARRDVERRTEAWLGQAGEPDLLRVGLRLRF
jgi:tetratricopeptide (TPR) repeat protein